MPVLLVSMSPAEPSAACSTGPPCNLLASSLKIGVFHRPSSLVVSSIVTSIASVGSPGLLSYSDFPALLLLLLLLVLLLVLLALPRALLLALVLALLLSLLLSLLLTLLLPVLLLR